MTTPDRTKLKIHPERAAADEAPAYLTSGLIAHVGIADANGPVVIPMTYQYDPATPRKLMPRLARLLNRARLTEQEVHILRGIARAAQRRP